MQNKLKNRLKNKMKAFLNFENTSFKQLCFFIYLTITINILKINTVETANLLKLTNTQYSTNSVSRLQPPVAAAAAPITLEISISREEKLKKINTDTIQQSPNNRNLKETISFLNKIDGFDSNRICSSLIRSDVQARLNRLKSLISTCPGPGFCRLAMKPNGTIYGTSDSKLETIFNLTQVSDKMLIKDSSLLGANYIRFISAGKYLCIDSQKRLVASKSMGKECLWYTNSKPITSASIRNVKLIIQKTQKICKIITLITKNINAAPDLGSCRNQIKIETAYPTELHKMKSNCVRINDNNHQQSTKQQQDQFQRQKLSTTILNEQTITASQTTSAAAAALTSSISFQNSLNDNKIPKNYATYITDLIKKLCTNYLNKNELIFFKKTNIIEYHYVIRLGSSSSEENLAEIPKKCLDYLTYSNLTDKFINNLKNELINNKKNREFLINHDDDDNSDEYYTHSKETQSKSTSATFSSVNNNNNNNKTFKKCYAFRNTTEYKNCMQKYYRCHQYNNDIDKLKKCRLKLGVTVASKLN